MQMPPGPQATLTPLGCTPPQAIPPGRSRIAIKDIVDQTAEKDPEYQKVVKEVGGLRHLLSLISLL